MCDIINLLRKNAPLAQLVEQLTLNQWVRGSSPRRCTNKQYGTRFACPILFIAPFLHGL